MSSNWARRSGQTTAERGYGGDHRRLRAQVKKEVDDGRGWCTAVVCLEKNRFIRPGSDWHLGHLPDRSGWSGAQHPSCNTTEGAVRGNPKGAGKSRKPPAQSPAQSSWRPTQRW